MPDTYCFYCRKSFKEDDLKVKLRPDSTALTCKKCYVDISEQPQLKLEPVWYRHGQPEVVHEGPMIFAEYKEDD